MADQNSDLYCTCCREEIRQTYAFCVECPQGTLICEGCIAKGIEFGPHKLHHGLLAMRLDMPILEAGWTAVQELELLDGLLRFGPNDWERISEHMGFVFSAKAIKEHYMRVYQGNSQFRINPAYIAHRTTSHNPPRFPPTSLLHSAFSGYSAARGEFQTDYDNDAETDVCNVDIHFLYDRVENWNDEENALACSLALCMLEMYNQRLLERKRRHEVMREHGLIQPQKNFLWLRRYDDSSMQWAYRGSDRHHASFTGVSSQIVKTLPKFSQFVSGFELDKLMEGLKLETELRTKLNELYELRRNGITTFQMVSMYKRYNQRHEEFVKERRKYLLNPFYCSKNISEGRAGKFPHLVTQSRRPAPPLDVSKLPGYDKLTAKERDLCSVARIVPDSFVEFKNILIVECLKQGGLRLAQARSLIKIDVNKTRKLYDFLIEEGFIYQPQTN